MTVLRATQKVLRYLPRPDTAAVSVDNALGDWYVNRIILDRRPLLLVLSSRSLLTILVPARDVASLPARLPSLVRTRLGRLGIDHTTADAEVAAMHPVAVAGTTDRAVVGYLVEFAKLIPFHVPADGWDETTLPFIAGWLAQVPCHLGKETVFPDRRTVELLSARWGQR